MYSTTHQKLIFLLSKLSEKLGALPVLWSKETKKYYVTLKSKQKYKESISLLYFSALFWGTQLLFPKRLSWLDESLLFVSFTGSLSYLIACIPYQLYSSELSVFLNEQVRHYYDFQLSFASTVPFPTKQQKLHQKLFERFALFLLKVSVAGVFNLTAHVLLYPNSAIYPYSFKYFVNLKTRSVIFKSVIYFISVYFAGRVGGILFVGFANGVSHACQVFYICFSILREFNRTLIENKFIENLSKTIIQYRTLEIQFMLFCMYYGLAFLSFLIVLFPGTVYCNYMLICNWSRAEINWIVKGILLSYIIIVVNTWFIVLSLGELFARQSKNTIMSWGKCWMPKRKEREILKRFQWSCRVMEFKQFSFNCKIKPGGAGKFILGLSRGTFRTVLARGIT